MVAGAGATAGIVVPTLVLFSFGLDSLLSRGKHYSVPAGHLGSALAIPLFGALIGTAVALVFWLIAIGPNYRAPHAA